MVDQRSTSANSLVLNIYFNKGDFDSRLLTLLTLDTLLSHLMKASPKVTMGFRTANPPALGLRKAANQARSLRLRTAPGSFTWRKAAGDDDRLVRQPGLVVRQHPRVEGHILPAARSQGHIANAPTSGVRGGKIDSLHMLGH